MSRLVESTNSGSIQVRPKPNSMQTSQTKKNPSNPATALKTQINEVSISSGMFLCSIMGETFVFNHSRNCRGVPPWAPLFCATQGAHGGTPLHKLATTQNIVPLPAFDAWITMNPASRLSNRDYFGTFLDGAPG